VCLTRRECNCGQYSKDTRDLVSESDLKIRFDKTRRSGSVRELHRLWKDIVNPYSLKNLTFATDKLTALAGIASLFSDRGLGRYVNGLWESTLVSDLFWGIDWGFAGYFHIVGRRAEGSSMPSWSWASVDGPVELNPMAEIEGLEIVEILFEPDKSGSLADVSTKTLILRGILINAHIWDGRKHEQDFINSHRRLTADGFGEVSWVVDVATEVACSPEYPMDAYVLCSVNGPGLVLELLPGSSKTYRRLGKVTQFLKDRGQYDTEIIRLV
jgi:hypothetical protein